LVKDYESAATRLLCDLIRYEDDKLTLADIRKRWKDGVYQGAPEAWAIAAIEHAKRQKA
jgi:hypothetical protein